jgi:hypothetical protein
VCTGSFILYRIRRLPLIQKRKRKRKRRKRRRRRKEEEKMWHRHALFWIPNSGK